MQLLFRLIKSRFPHHISRDEWDGADNYFQHTPQFAKVTIDNDLPRIGARQLRLSSINIDCWNVDYYF